MVKILWNKSRKASEGPRITPTSNTSHRFRRSELCPWPQQEQITEVAISIILLCFQLTLNLEIQIVILCLHSCYLMWRLLPLKSTKFVKLFVMLILISLFITGTWLKEHIDITFIAILGYSVICCDRHGANPGGACIYIRLYSVKSSWGSYGRSIWRFMDSNMPNMSPQRNH